jgi:hypothetical protein
MEDNHLTHIIIANNHTPTLVILVGLTYAQIHSSKPSIERIGGEDKARKSESVAICVCYVYLWSYMRITTGRVPYRSTTVLEN